VSTTQNSPAFRIEGPVSPEIPGGVIRLRIVIEPGKLGNAVEAVAGLVADRRLVMTRTGAVIGLAKHL
jgi:hypothetical protein